MKLQVGYVGSQGHRLLATHDINYRNPQTCLDLNNISNLTGDASLACGQFFADSSFNIAAGEIPAGVTCICLTVRKRSVTRARIRRRSRWLACGHYSSPHCDPLTGAGCPADRHSGFLQHLRPGHDRQLRHTTLCRPRWRSDFLTACSSRWPIPSASRLTRPPASRES